MITLEVMEALIGRADAPDWYPAIRDACEAFEINTPEREAPFLAQAAHESGGFVRLEENLNYSAQRLLDVFPKYFKTFAMAGKYARQPEAIANRVYANRMGNGDAESGDGWMYRGRGLFQLTGRHNYRVCGEGIGLNLEFAPELVATDLRIAAYSAAWFWFDNGLNEYADSGDFTGLTRKINGGTHGLEDRIAWLDKVKELMA